MKLVQIRKSYDTNIKHLARYGLLHDILTTEQLKEIPNSNISRWKNEAEDKYAYSELNEILKQEIDLIKVPLLQLKIKKVSDSETFLL